MSGWRALALGTALALSLQACGDDGPARPSTAVLDQSVTVASFDFGESIVLAEIYAEALSSAGFPVDRQVDLGPREIVAPALEQGLVDLVPEYLGTAMAYFRPDSELSDMGAAEVSADLSDAMEGWEVLVLDHAAAENENAVAVTRATATEMALEVVSDLVPHAGQMAFGGPPECPERPFCLAGLEERYGLRFREFVPLDSGGPLTIAALLAGEVQAALLFSTDGNLASGELVLLEDDLVLQPAENVVPVLREAMVERFGSGLVDTINAVSARITTDVLVELNRRLDAEVDPTALAAEWLASEGLTS